MMDHPPGPDPMHLCPLPTFCSDVRKKVALVYWYWMRKDLYAPEDSMEDIPPKMSLMTRRILDMRAGTAHHCLL